MDLDGVVYGGDDVAVGARRSQKELSAGLY